jgi:hypothetical protein
LASCIESLWAYGHLHDKLEFIENGVHTCIFYDVFDVGVYAGSSFIEVSHLYIIGISPLLVLNITSRCLDSTCRHLPNKLEFVVFGVHLQKFCQFWFLHRAVVPPVWAVVLP